MTFAEYLRSELESLDREKCSEVENPPLAGEQCPRCKEGALEYDSTLNLVCTECDYVVAGVCT